MLGDLWVVQSPSLNPEQLGCWITSSLTPPSVTDELGKTLALVTYLVHELHQLSLVIESNVATHPDITLLSLNGHVMGNQETTGQVRLLSEPRLESV